MALDSAPTTGMAGILQAAVDEIQWRPVELHGRLSQPVDRQRVPTGQNLVVQRGRLVSPRGELQRRHMRHEWRHPVAAQRGRKSLDELIRSLLV